MFIEETLAKMSTGSWGLCEQGLHCKLYSVTHGNLKFRMISHHKTSCVDVLPVTLGKVNRVAIIGATKELFKV